MDEFLYMDPETSEIVAMVADEHGFRPAMATEISDAMLAAKGTSLPPQQSLLDSTSSELTAFIQEQVRRYCLDQSEAEAWDDSYDQAAADCPGM